MNRGQRLRGRVTFAAVRAAGHEARAGRIRVRAVHTGRASRAGFAIVGAAGAVRRNRLRRQLRAAAGPLLGARPGYDVVVSVSGAGAAPVFAELSRWLERAWGRALEGAQAS